MHYIHKNKCVEYVCRIYNIQYIYIYTICLQYQLHVEVSLKKGLDSLRSSFRQAAKVNSATKRLVSLDENDPQWDETKTDEVYMGQFDMSKQKKLQI